MANENARKLRKRLTPQEVKLWSQLRSLKLFGHHFRRQVPLGSYIVDFACFGQRIVIEVDGGQHGLADGMQHDARRDAFLKQQGFRVLRFWNSDIDQNLEGVVDSIVAELGTPTPTG